MHFGQAAVVALPFGSVSTTARPHRTQPHGSRLQRVEGSGLRFRREPRVNHAEYFFSQTNRRCPLAWRTGRGAYNGPAVSIEERARPLQPKMFDCGNTSNCESKEVTLPPLGQDTIALTVLAHPQTQSAIARIEIRTLPDLVSC